MEDIKVIQGSMAQMQAQFTEQMAAYEGKLQGQSPASASVATLAAEFSMFKSFVLMSLRALQDQIQATALAVDQLEMLSRRKHLLLHGVPEDSKEDTTATVVRVVAGQLELAGFAASDINRCHRMGRLTSDRSRPILLKLRDVSIRDRIWFAKTHLKNTGLTLSEFLTRARHEVFMQARQRFGITKSWTREGNVYVVGPDDTRHRVGCLADLDKLSSSQTVASVATASTSSPVVAKPVAAVKQTAATKSKRTVASKK